MKLVMDQKTLELLEFHKIQTILGEQASTGLGRDLARDSYPLGLDAARKAQRAGRELQGCLGHRSAPDISGAKDVGSRVLGAKRGAVLSPEDLLHVCTTLVAFQSLRDWLSKLRGEYPELWRVRSCLPELSRLAARLAEVVGDDGAIKDTASPKLASIRRAYRALLERIRKRAEEMVRQPSVAIHLQDPLVTIRNGRYVLPVKQESANRVRGLVHDHSATGQTVFIEPAELLEMGNDSRRLELDERDEVERILTEVSGQVGEVGELIAEGVKALAEFDLGLAKARLAFKWKGSFPVLVQDHCLSLQKAWHPLLKGNPVPMDLSLSEKGTRTVVITGPNMGGKTVALKTCGLLTAMALSGFPCPCSAGSQVGNIREILCDIGDEQSIEANLSTFSAHISNVIRIVKEAGPGKLVLMDELAAGTDPQEGAALAAALLKKLNSSGAVCVVTTHYSEVKVLAQETPGMENASVEWDAASMRPTYRLIAGRPGRSYAFDVAKKLGLPEDVIAEAKGHLSEDALRLDELILDMEISAKAYREEAQKAKHEREKAAALKEEYEERLQQLERERKETVERAKDQAQAIVRRARTEFEEAVKEFKARAKEAQALQEAPRLREKLKGASREFAPGTASFAPGTPLTDAVVGQTVVVSGLGQEGTVLEKPEEDGTVLVRVGSLSLRTSLDRLRAGRKKASQFPEPRETKGFGKIHHISPEVSLRGMTRDEALLTLDKYMDDALMASLKEIRIIHGKGTGVLRNAVAEYLRRSPFVQDFRLGGPGEGGDGVTVARLA